MIDFRYIMSLILRFFYEMCGVRINKKTDVIFFVTFLMRLMSTKAGTIQFELNKMRWWTETNELDFFGCESLLGKRPAVAMALKAARNSLRFLERRTPPAVLRSLGRLERSRRYSHARRSPARLHVLPAMHF